jgi:hypothetical protein
MDTMLAKGKVYVSKEKMAELLSLPEDVELVAVRVKEYDEGYEFLVLSAEETVCTKKGVPMSQLRRTSVETLEHFNQPRCGIVATGQTTIVDLAPRETILTNEQMEQIMKGVKEFTSSNQNVRDLNIDIKVIKQDEKSVQQIFDEIVKNTKLKGTK